MAKGSLYVSIWENGVLVGCISSCHVSVALTILPPVSILCSFLFFCQSFVFFNSVYPPSLWFVPSESATVPLWVRVPSACVSSTGSITGAGDWISRYACSYVAKHKCFSCNNGSGGAQHMHGRACNGISPSDRIVFVQLSSPILSNNCY